MKYFGAWDNLQGMLSSFVAYGLRGQPLSLDTITGPVPQDNEVLFASYGGRDYEGHAYVLFQCDDTLWEVETSHCSCNGLEGSWRPNVTTWAAQRLKKAAGATRYGWLSDHDKEAQDAFFELVAQHPE
jgi:hypothetical protein